MFKLLLLVAAVLGSSHCLTMQHTAYYRLFYGGQMIPVKIENNQISFVGCNKNIGSIDVGSIFFQVISWNSTDKKNTCEVDNDEKIKGEFNRVLTRQERWGDLNLEDENLNKVFTLIKDNRLAFKYP